MASCIAFSAASCVSTPPFVCTASDQCSEGGVCEPAGFCSFPANDCASSRRRYSELAGAGLAGTCVLLDLDGTYILFPVEDYYTFFLAAPEQVSGCIPGGDQGLEVTYSEGMRATAARAIRYEWDNEEAERVGLGAAPSVNPAQINNETLSAHFGLDLTATDTSENAGNGVSALVPAGEFAICYRQREQREKVANLAYQNTSGQLATVGQVFVIYHTWEGEVAVGNTCETTVSQLPEGDDVNTH